MNKLRAIELFVRLVEVGSFTRLAEQERTSKSMVSKEISRLEQDLGARLLHRTTRNIQLTHVGKEYLKYANEILNKVGDADAFVKTLAQAPRGKIKVNAPMALGITDLSMLFADFMRAYPDVDIDIHLGDENIDLVAEGFDLGFRASSQPFDSNYIGRALCEFQYHLCAGSGYFNHHAHISSAQDLLAHNCFEYAYFKGKNVWPVDGFVATSGSLRVNSVLFMLQVIKADLGIGYLPEFVCRELLEKGELVEVLPDSEKSKLTLYALYPARQFVPPAVIQCINFVERWFESHKPL